MSEEIKSSINTAIEDLNSISENTDDWVKQYIAPIKNIRSFSKVILAKSDKKTDPLSTMTMNSKRTESMVHAFYRYIGFPVVSIKNNTFYNAGFDSSGFANNERIKNIDIDFNSSDTKLLMFFRENDYIGRTKIFARQDNSSSLYALALRFPKPFNVLDTSMGPFDVDWQSGTIKERDGIINSFYIFNDRLIDNQGDVVSYLSSQIPGANLTNFRHVLRPFILDPDVTKAVNPSNKEICVPFLENIESATRNGPNPSDQLFRPKLEEIIRARLTGSSNDKTFLQNIIAIFEKDKSPPEDVSSLDSGTLRATALALADENDVDKGDIEDIFGEFTPVQIIRVSYYIKLIKVAIKKLFKSINILHEVLKRINWVPLPDPEGTEFKRKATIDQNLISDITDLDKEITDCKRSLVEAKATAETRTDLRFPPPELGLTVKDNVKIFTERLRELEGLRDKIAAKGFQALRDIEIITGEISGLGFVDIIAIHATLWALDEKSLINLLDDNAFNRMVLFNDDLITDTVRERFLNNDKQNIEDTLVKFEKILINILSFADRELERQFDNPTKKESGAVNA